jgi:hypothetical protein
MPPGFGSACLEPTPPQPAPLGIIDFRCDALDNHVEAIE